MLFDDKEFLNARVNVAFISHGDMEVYTKGILLEPATKFVERMVKYESKINSYLEYLTSKSESLIVPVLPTIDEKNYMHYAERLGFTNGNNKSKLGYTYHSFRISDFELVEEDDISYTVKLNYDDFTKKQIIKCLEHAAYALFLPYNISDLIIARLKQESISSTADEVIYFNTGDLTLDTIGSNLNTFGEVESGYNMNRFIEDHLESEFAYLFNEPNRFSHLRTVRIISDWEAKDSRDYLILDNLKNHGSIPFESFVNDTFKIKKHH